MSGIKRRSALRLIGTAPLALGWSLRGAEAARAAEAAAKAVGAARAGTPYKPKFFTPHEWETVRVLVDLVIPKDDRSGSATDAGVPEFMDFYLTDPLEGDRGREWRQTAMRGGLAWIDAECRRRHAGKTFRECAEAERAALLDDIAYAKDDERADDPRRPQVRLRPGASFFHSFRDLTASGFWSSKMGIEDLGYIGNTFVREFPPPPAEVLKKLGVALAAAAFLAAPARAQVTSVGDWPIHDRNRPAPKVIDPGTASTQEQPGKPPSDAIVLFGGKDLAGWKSVKDGGPAKWKVENGYMEVVKGTGYIETTQAFGDCQLHVEWMAPNPPVGQDQDRGNSGVFLMGLYEVQVVDSYQNVTYPDGQAAALYGQYPPLVNAARPPGQWQTYDIVFRAPRFDGEKLTRPARVTVFHNGVLVQEGVELTGPTAHKARPPYKAHAAKLPLALQDHDHPVRYRNIWVRELSD